MAKNLNIGSRKPLFKNRIINRFSVKYGFLSLLIFFMGIFLFPSSAHLATITSDNIVEMTNQEREEKGSSRLRVNNSLKKAARQKAESILKEQNFEHDLQDKKFSHWIKKAEYNYKYAGENLAIDFTEAENVVSSWMNSDSHRQNILNNKYKEIGVSVLKGEFQGQETVLVVQIFGTQKNQGNIESKNSTSELSTQALDKKEKNGSSSLILQTASISYSSVDKLFLLRSISSNIWQHESLWGYKYSIFILISVFVLCYFYLYFLFSFLFKKHRYSNGTARKY